MESHEFLVGITLVNVQALLEHSGDIFTQRYFGRYPVSTLVGWRNFLDDDSAKCPCLIKIHKRAIVVVEVIASNAEGVVCVKHFDSFLTLGAYSGVEVDFRVWVIFEVDDVPVGGQNDAVTLLLHKTDKEKLRFLPLIHSIPEDRSNADFDGASCFSHYYAV